MLNNKTDSKIRFQSRAFKTRLKKAQGFKRQAPKSPNFAFGKFLTAIPMPVKLSTLGLAMIFSATFFWPGIFYVRNVKINGLNEEQTSKVKAALAEYFLKPSLLPKNNLLTLSGEDLKKTLQSSENNILTVVSIKKYFPNSLEVSVLPKSGKFLLSEKTGTSFIISNDLSLKRASEEKNTGNLIKINYESDENFEDTAYYSDSKILDLISSLNARLKNTANLDTDYFALNSQQPGEIKAVQKNGSAYIFSREQDIAATVERLNLLLNSIDPKDEKRLAYIDMTVKNRGYVCLKNTPCANPAILTQISTTTASTTSAVK